MNKIAILKQGFACKNTISRKKGKTKTKTTNPTRHKFKIWLFQKGENYGKCRSCNFSPKFMFKKLTPGVHFIN